MSMIDEKSMMRETTEMHKIRFALRREINRRELQDQNMNVYFYEHMARSLMLEIEGFVWAQTVEDRIEYQVPTMKQYKTYLPRSFPKVPASFWDYCKQAFLAPWILKYFPVKYLPMPKPVKRDIPMRTETKVVNVVYPNLKLAFPRERNTVQVHTMDRY